MKHRCVAMGSGGREGCSRPPVHVPTRNPVWQSTSACGTLVVPQPKEGAMSAPKFTVGQHVVVHDINWDRRRDDQGIDGEVVKVGRKLVHVLSGGSGRPQAFRIEDGTANDDYGHQWIRTYEDEALDQRRRVARATLHANGISVSNSSLTVEQLEALAAVMAS